MNGNGFHEMSASKREPLPTRSLGWLSPVGCLVSRDSCPQWRNVNGIRRQSTGCVISAAVIQGGRYRLRGREAASEGASLRRPRWHTACRLGTLSGEGGKRDVLWDPVRGAFAKASGGEGLCSNSRVALRGGRCDNWYDGWRAPSDVWALWNCPY
jgi:hypothetical protein